MEFIGCLVPITQIANGHRIIIRLPITLIAVDRIKALRANRDNNEVKKQLEAIREDIRSDGPLIPAVIEAVKVDATLGEIWKIFKEEYGWGYVKNI